jgi:hypothetical protein
MLPWRKKEVASYVRVFLASTVVLGCVRIAYAVRVRALKTRVQILGAYSQLSAASQRIAILGKIIDT